MCQFIHVRVDLYVYVCLLFLPVSIVTIRYDTIEEFNVDSKAEYTA